jgi:hypothetical protein
MLPTVLICRQAATKQLFLHRLMPWLELRRDTITLAKTAFASSGPPLPLSPPCSPPHSPPINKPAGSDQSRGDSRFKKQCHASPKRIFEHRIRDSKENWRIALTLLQEMLASDHGASLYAYNAAINACARGKQTTIWMRLGYHLT